jgi:hypothetical protein
MQSTKAQQQRRKEKVTWKILTSTARANRAGFGGTVTTPKTVARASQLFSASEPPLTLKLRNYLVYKLTKWSYNIYPK